MSSKKKLNWLSRLFRFINILVALGLVLSYLATYVSPEKAKFLVLFGISFPIWFALNMLFVGFWLLRRKSFIFVSLICLLLGYNHINNFIQLSWSSKPEAEENSFKIMSYNVKLFGLYTWNKNVELRENIFKQLDQEDPDIVCFQEFYFTENRKGFQTKSLLLEQFKGASIHEKYTHELIHHQYFGVATLTKFPIVGKGYIEFNNDRNNFCIYSDLKINQDTIRLFNGHFASIRFKPEDYQFVEKLKDSAKEIDTQKITNITDRLTNAAVKRASQINKVMEEISKSPYPVVLAGDFNDAPVSYAYQQVRKQLNDSFIFSGNGIGNTYIGTFPSFRIDYIFHDNHFTSHKYKTLPEKYSDHHAIRTILEIKHNQE